MMYTMHMYLPTMIYVNKNMLKYYTSYNKPRYVDVLTIMMYNIHMYLPVIIYVNKHLKITMFFHYL